MNFLNFSSHLKKYLVIVAFLFILISSSLLLSDERITNTNPELRLKWYQQYVNMRETSMFKNLSWQFLGPLNISGRMTDTAIVVPKGKHYTIYVAGASGGVWKTENEGVSWEPIFAHAQSTSIGDITIAPSNQNIIWIGSGEANIFRSSQAGAGVYKSTDGGKTWTHKGLIDTNTIPRIIIHPQNPDIVYVAASGHEWTTNSERGIYKTTDGGNTWNKIFYIDEQTGAIDLVMNPADPDTLYASTWQRMRKKWNDPRNEADYTGSSIYKTTDAGKTWNPIDNGLPPVKYRGRIGIDLCLTKPNILYAFIDNYEKVADWDKNNNDSYGRPRSGIIKGATVFRSDDSGANWRQVSRNDNYMMGISATYGWVFGQIRVDPNNENKIYVMGVELHVSEDGGKTFRLLEGMHGDHHGLWIDPANSNYLVNVNDGGLAISYDGGKNWRTFADKLPLVQFFNAMYDMDTPFRVYGSIQDHGSYRCTVDLGRGRNNIPAATWESAPGGEGSSHAVDPTDPNTVYSAGFYGNITRTNMITGEEKLIVPKPGKDEARYRGQWLAPFIISSHNPRIIYHGMNFLFRSMDRGDSWEKISPDLTYNDPAKSGDIPYQTIFAISESPLKFGLIYVGTDDGRVHVTRDSGASWKEITAGLPFQKWVSRLAASAFDLGTVYMTQNGKRDDDFAAYVWKSTDFGETWQDISANIPCGPVNVIREDPKNKNVLYVGTDFGVYVTLDGGKNWHVLPQNMPTTYVHDLVIHPRENILIAATHGRGMWALDASLIQESTDQVLVKQAHLFKIEAMKLPRWAWWGWEEMNPAHIFFYLQKSQQVKLAIKDNSGKLVREFQVKGDAGLNVVAWDFTREGLKETREFIRQYPFVAAGNYTVELLAGSIIEKGTIDVKK